MNFNIKTLLLTALTLITLIGCGGGDSDSTTTTNNQIGDNGTTTEQYIQSPITLAVNAPTTLFITFANERAIIKDHYTDLNVYDEFNNEIKGNNSYATVNTYDFSGGDYKMYVEPSFTTGYQYLLIYAKSMGDILETMEFSKVYNLEPRHVVLLKFSLSQTEVLAVQELGEGSYSDYEVYNEDFIKVHRLSVSSPEIINAGSYYLLISANSNTASFKISKI